MSAPEQQERVRVPQMWLQAYHGDEDLARRAYEESLQTEERVRKHAEAHARPAPRRVGRFSRSQLDHPGYR